MMFLCASDIRLCLQQLSFESELFADEMDFDLHKQTCELICITLILWFKTCYHLFESRKLDGKVCEVFYPLPSL